MSTRGKQAPTSRLRVRREVVRNLSAHELVKVGGGGITDLLLLVKTQGACRQSAMPQ